MDIDPEKYYAEFAEACIRCPPDKRDLKKYFKRYDTKELPRIVKVLGMLKNVRPLTMLDVGSGRGRSLWPMAYNLPHTRITCIDSSEWRCNIINAVHDGGVTRVCSFQGDVSKDFKHCDFTFDVVTALEVIEHIPDARAAVSEMIRFAGKYFIASVPSKPDNNPDHIHLFNTESFEELLNNAEKETGKKIGRIVFDYIPKHILVFARLEG